MSGIIAKKLQMTQIAKDDAIVPVTLLHVPKHVITQVKTTEKDGYNAVVVDVMEGDKVLMKKELDYSIEELEALAALTAAPAKEEVVEEAPESEAKEEPKEEKKEEVAEEKKEDGGDSDAEEEEEVASSASTSPYVGTEIPVAVLAEIESVKMTGVSKGKGFTGAMKRWNFHGGPASHGSKFHRALGSIGTRKPRRTKPGRKMHGRHGNKTVTLASVPVELVDSERRIVAVRGAVPGARNSYVHLQF